MIGARLTDQRAFTLMEVMIGMFVLLSGLLGSARVLLASDRADQTSQRRAIATHVAQRELEAIGSHAYADLMMNAAAAPTNDPRHPTRPAPLSALFVGAGMGPFCAPDPTFVYCGYELAIVGDGASKVVAGPTPYEVKSGGTTVKGMIYRYVTWRDENCAATVCDTPWNTKRVSVAVTVDPPNNAPAATSPVWVSSIVTDPAAGNGQPGTGSTYDAISTPYYLYDTPCNNASQVPTTADHVTRSTASYSANPGAGTAAAWSLCSNGPAGNAADLMGTGFPTSASPGQPRNYSADSGDAYSGGGLHMRRDGAASPADCGSAETKYDDASASVTTGTNKWNVHRWTTAPFASAQTLGRSSLKLFTKRLNASVGNEAGTICVNLLARSENGPAGSPPYATDTPLVSTKITRNAWNASDTTWTGFTSRFSRDANNDGKPDGLTVPAGSRLVLVISMRGDSAGDIAFAYGDPIYSSSLTVDTCGTGQCS